MHPRAFFEIYVAPTIDEWRSDSGNIRLSVLALCQLDILAEHVIIHRNPNIKREAIAAKRRKLCEKQPALELAWDVHDTHKHGPLTEAKKVKRIRLISRGQQPSIIRQGAAFQANAFQTNAFQTGTKKVTLTLDNGTIQDAENVIEACLAYWSTELRRIVP